jgi:Icc-related predicted phosphoesterase
MLVTHMPTLNLLGFGGYGELEQPVSDICATIHPRRKHCGCGHLHAEVVRRIRPSACVFGHVNECNGAVQECGVLFVNAAVDMVPTPRAFTV